MYVSFILKVIICTNKRSEHLKYTVIRCFHYVTGVTFFKIIFIALLGVKKVCVAVLQSHVGIAELRPHALYYCFVFCRNHFIDVYRHIFIAALEFMLRRSREIALRTLLQTRLP